MWRYVAKRLTIGVPLLFLVTTAVFWAFQLIPGDPARLYVGYDAAPEAVAAVRHELGLDQPAVVRYVAYLRRLAGADLGRSVASRRPVLDELRPRIAATVKLATASIVVAAVLGIALGSLAASRRGQLADKIAATLSLAAISVPVFWLGLMMASLLSVRLGILPSAGTGTWRHYVMPTTCLAAFSLAFIARITRSSLLEVLAHDYVRTARAKGVSEARVLYGHALRNALMPITTVVGLRFGYMLGGAVVTEAVFAWPGLGQSLVTAVAQRDIPMVQGILLFFALTFLLVNLGVDVLYACLDPRIRY